MTDEIKLRKNKIVEQKPLGTKNIEDDGFSDILNDDGEIGVQLNQEVIIQRISKDLYKNAKSGLRELLMNAFRACRIAKKEYGERNPHIIVKYDSPNRSLTIHDINAQGISKERFKKVLLVLGNSDNLNSGETGQFGMGFASYTTLSSTVLLETKYRTEDGKGASYAMLGRQGLKFKQVKRDPLENYGTKLTLQLHNEITLQEVYEMEDMVKTIGKLQNIDCTLMVDDDVEKIEHMSLVELVKKKLSMRGEDGAVEFHAGVENDIEYAVAFPNYNANTFEMFLGGAPIKMEGDVQMMGAVGYFNALDEDKYKPMPERERFTTKAESAIREVVENTIFKKIIAGADLPSDIQGMFKTKNKQLIKRMHSAGKLQQYAPQLIDVVQTLQHTRISYTTNQAKGKKLLNTDMYEALTQFQDTQFLRYTMLTKRYRMAVEEEFENILYIKDASYFPKEIQEQIPLLPEYIKEHGLIMPKQDAIPTTAVLHSSFRGYYNTTHFEGRDTSKTIVMAKEGQIMDVISSLKDGKSDYYFVKNYHVFEDFSISWDEYIEAVKGADITFGGKTDTTSDIVDNYQVFSASDNSKNMLTESLAKTLQSEKSLFYVPFGLDIINAYPGIHLDSLDDIQFIRKITDSKLANRDFTAYMLRAKSPVEKIFVNAVSRVSYQYDDDMAESTTFPAEVSKFQLNEWNLVKMAKLHDKFNNRPDEFKDFKVSHGAGEYAADGLVELFNQYYDVNRPHNTVNHLLAGGDAKHVSVKNASSEVREIEMTIPGGLEFKIPKTVQRLVGEMEILSVKPLPGNYAVIKIRWEKND